MHLRTKLCFLYAYFSKREWEQLACVELLNAFIPKKYLRPPKTLVGDLQHYFLFLFIF